MLAGRSVEGCATGGPVETGERLRIEGCWSRHLRLPVSIASMYVDALRRTAGQHTFDTACRKCTLSNRVLSQKQCGCMVTKGTKGPARLRLSLSSRMAQCSSRLYLEEAVGLGIVVFQGIWSTAQAWMRVSFECLSC